MNMIENKMGTKPVLPLIFSMAIPAMISMLIYSLYNIVDSYFVSLISEKALRAVSIIFPVQILIISLGVGLGVGTSAIVSRKLGNNSFHNANLTAHQGFLITFAIGILFAITGIFLSRPFLKIMTSDFEVFSMGLEYMSIIYLFANFSLLELVFEKSVQATGQMIIPMISQTTGAVINMILDPVLIFGLFGFPELRIKGATAEYQRFFLRAPTRLGPLWQIWTRTGFGPGPTGPTRPAHPICLRFRFSPPLPGPNMAPREDRSGAHPTARPSEPRNHAETDGHTRGGGPNDPPRAPES